jgi:hypothetical protein
MRKLLGFVLLLVLIVGGVGWYLGWFRFSTSSNADTGNRDVHLNIDTNKIKKDAQNAKEKITGSNDKTKPSPEDK